MIFKLKTSLGSTLLLSLLAMATIGSTIYVVGNVTNRFIKQVFGITTGEMALFASDAALEQGLYAQIRDSEETGDCDTEPAVYSKSNLSSKDLLEISIEFCRSKLRDNPFELDLPPSFEEEIFVIDPEAPDQGSGYEKLSFSWIGGSGDIKICSWENLDCANSPDVRYIQNMNSSSSNTLVNLDPSRNYYVLIESSIFGFSFSTTSEPKGLPSETITIFGRSQFPPHSSRALDVEIAP